MKQEAWVTSAVEDEAVTKSIILAGSLRRVRTAKPMVVITTLSVTEDLREKLKENYDWVLFLDRENPNGLSLEEYAKVFAFSLVAFKKCVYLSPNALVLKNCDEIFGRYKNFAANYITPGGDIDHSVFVYAPSLELRRSLGKLANCMDAVGSRANKGFSKHFNLLLKNNVVIQEMDDCFNLRLHLKGGVRQSLTSKASIINFADAYPLQLSESFLKEPALEIGTMEKFAVEHCWRIYIEDMKISPENAMELKYTNEPIAIVGMSFRLPGGNDVDEFWSLLAEGRDAIVPVPSHRWTKNRSLYHCKNRKVEAGFLNIPIDEIDAKFFGFNPKEAEFLDPQQRLLLEVTWEALEDAMIDPLKLRGTQTGVFVGSWMHDYKDVLRKSADVDFFRVYMGNSIASTAARVSHFLETTGPSIATESGCSSGIAAMDMACKSLRNGDSSLAIAGGVNLLLHPFEPNLMEYVLSPEHRCKTFDAEANGFVRAEACAVLLMKRLSDAVKDEDNIWGLVRGSALTQEGVSKSFGTPTVHCESLALELALKEADVDPRDVSYVEAHGTGTSVGDPLEIMAINRVYSKGRTEPLLIGSVKTNVGHTESVSGITGIIKVLLSMKNEMIPQHLHLKTLNPNINLEAIPAKIPLTSVSWPKTEERKRIAGVSSFGISGTDGHAIIEEPPNIFRPRLDLNQERPLHLMKISAKSNESMDELLQKYLNIFNEKIEKCEDSEKDFANLAYSANIGRATFNHRAVIKAKNFTESAKILKEKSLARADVQSSGNNLCFLFTGQGSQYPNMSKQLYETSAVFKETFDKCDEVLNQRYGISIRRTLWADEGKSEELSRTLYSQTSIFVVEYCLLKLWESWGVKPDYVIGHSLGEFAAAVAAGALDFEDALMLVAERSRLIDSLPRGKMLVIKADKNAVDEAISTMQKKQPNFWADYAALNSPDQTVVAGDSLMIEEFAKLCKEKSLKSIVLAATHAFHSRHMDPMLKDYEKVAKMVRRKPHVREDLPKYISGMEGKLLDIESIGADYWVRHTREKVSYIDACQVLHQEGCTLFLEVGPHPVLSALTMMNMEGKQISCLPSIRRKEDEWVTMLDSLSKLYLSDWRGEIDWKGFDRFYNRETVKLPFYPFNRKPVWSKFEPEYTKVHPLLGSIVPTASNESIFQNSLTVKNASFVQDHVIGNTIIFPGAGFLEMCLAGGHATVQGLTEELAKPRRPILLKALKIVSPLALLESGACKVQTIVVLNDKSDSDDELGYSVGVHRLADSEDGTGKWIQHASAKFLPLAPSLPKNLSDQIDIVGIQSSWKKSDNRDFYEKLPEVGLRFGPQFQSLEFGWKSENGVLVSVKVPQDHRNYLMHPVIADAMIQAIMLWTSKEKMKKKLQVPVQIEEFIWLKETESMNQFVYCCNGEANKAHCILVDETGSPLAYMKGVDFIETTAKLVEGMITQQSTAMPKLWEDVWKNSFGPMQGNVSHEASLKELDYTDDDLKYFHEKNNISLEEKTYYRNLVNLSRFSILKALYILGWKPEKMQNFTVDSLIEDLNINRRFKQYIQFFLRSLSNKDCSTLRAWGDEGNTFCFLADPPTMEDLEKSLNYVTSPNDFMREEYRLIMELEKCLSKMLTGEVDPLSILFPDNDSTKPSAAKFYDSCRLHCLSNRPFESKAIKHINTANRHYSSNPKQSLCRPVYRILEVGAGTAVFTKESLKNLALKKEEGIDTEYYVTDISAAFFSSAEADLEEHRKSLVFKKYDMEKDPLEQGLCPGYFDLVTATEVFHIAKDIKKTLRSVRSLLKPGGLVLISETVCLDERITFVFGLLDGYWQFQDREFRKHHTTLSPDMWREALTESGFCGASVVPLYNNVHGVITAYASHCENTFLQNLRPPAHSWIIFGEYDSLSEGLQKKMSNVNRKSIIVPQPTTEEVTEAYMEKHLQRALKSAADGVERIEGVVYLWSLVENTRNQAKVSLPFVTLMKLVSELKTIPKVFAVMKGTCTVESSDAVDPTSGTLIGFCKALSNENPSLRHTYLDLDPNKTSMEQIDELFTNLWVEHKQGAAFRDGLRLCPKLTAAKILRNEPLSLPNGCDRFQLVLPKTRLISDLEFAYLEPFTIEDQEVEVQVKAMALNFRDVFTVLKPIPIFEKINTVGLEFTGVVVRTGRNVSAVKIGDRVMGMVLNDNLSLPSHYKIREEGLVLLPNTMTFAEGVTLPAVICTSVYCLITIAKMKRGDTVLIHTASGGVGLSAIQLCNYVGANIIATAGSPRKRTYLRNLGIKHVFNSRTTDYKNEILKVTGGHGVDIVLNSITGPGFKEASLDVLATNGRFIEMSKLNVWSKEEVNELRPDAFYEQVDLTSLEPEDYKILTDQLRENLCNGIIKPIPYERFDALNIRGALNYLQKAKHIGKIVCIMPEVKLERSNLVSTTPLFNENSTYLVTGGLGGIGFEIVKWMLNKGAKHIAIVSRSAPRPDIAPQIEAWNRAGKHVHAFSVDVGDYDKCSALLKDLKKPELGFPQLRGIMHAAGVLRDAILENQSWETFSQTYNPKVNGSWNLHDLTKDYLLEHFVLFSSIAATFGSPGQTNHSASNAFEDSLASYRKGIGLPATCVNWGNWGEVGVATEIDVPGIRPISTAQGLLALEEFLKTQTSHMTVLNVDSFSLILKLFPQVKHYLDDCRLLGEVKTSLIINSDEFWHEVDSAEDREAKMECFKKFIKITIRNILKMDADEPIQDQTEFQALGVDSLMMLEMKNGMQNILGGRMTLTASQLKDCNNAEELATTLVNILLGGSSEEKVLSQDELNRLVREDSNLISQVLLRDTLKTKSIDQVETVFLTGATGTLGPYLLSDLSKRKQVKKVYCLVRSSGELPGKGRLYSRLDQTKIAEAVDLSKVEVIDGDITVPKFGLTDELYLDLCEKVDAVVHTAIRSDHTAKYWKAPESNKSHVRTVNVLGTARLLEFAGERTLKHFYHASTMIAFTGMGEAGQFSEGWQSVSAFDDMKFGAMGYVLTKHISEQLVRQALLKGIPCKAFRFPVISGDSMTGRIDYSQNHSILRWLACMRIGAIHDIPAPFTIMAVDHCAKISLDIFFNPEAPMEIYNVVQKSMEVEQILVEVLQNFGIEMEVISHVQFMQRLKSEDENSPIAAFIKMYEEEEDLFTAMFENPSTLAFKNFFENGSSFLDTTKLTQYAPEYDKLVEIASDILKRDFAYLINEGVFTKYGIKVSLQSYKSL